MPKRNDIKKILIIGSGPIIIGQACEFDYSGVQACKSLKEEDFEIILLNSNPATIMTDPDIADKTYIEPICYSSIKKILEIEKPDAILPTVGGQIALNSVIELDKRNILKNIKTEIIGITIKSIKKAEDRRLFHNSMRKIGLKTAKYGIANNEKDAMLVLENIGLPCIIRSSFVMGGDDSGIAYNKKKFIKICKNYFERFPYGKLSIDEFLFGWKEYEMEALRDKNGNCIIICSMENVDPMGVHTGDSITVMPAQTLTDKEYQIMRSATISVLKEIGINHGGSNVQFAINPKDGKLIVIEMNPRISRSSALASKATGFPIAKISAKLAVGYTLDELFNDITNNSVTASFEPSIDYIVTKIPRFNFEKFKGSKDRLNTSMKSVGEVMAIGRTQQESLQKALRSLEINADGLISKINLKSEKYLDILKNKLKYANSERIFYIADAFRVGLSISEIYNLTRIDVWFLNQIKELVKIEKKIISNGFEALSDINYLRYLKCKGFSDARIAYLVGSNESSIRKIRLENKICPVYKRVDTCAAEFITNTAYMYSTYEDECESYPNNITEKIIVLGSGPNRIGQGIEFDYCCVQAILTLKDNGYETIMINCNPETVSTDYDISDRLYFEPVTTENILDIIRIEKPYGIIVQYGGETPLKLSHELSKAGVRLIGISSNSIDQAENRIRFQKIIKEIGLKHPLNIILKDMNLAQKYADTIGYPIIMRPSYILGGKYIKIIYNKKDLKNYINSFKLYDNLNILMEKFLEYAKEVEIDMIYDGENIFFGSIVENIEYAGIHSGDSTCFLPPCTLSSNIQDSIFLQSKKIAFKLGIIGLINIQFIIKNNDIFVIEVNPRASRTVPFVSKAIGISLIRIATKVLIGKSLKEQKLIGKATPKYFAVKKSIFPFMKFINSNLELGPEMHSTGEVMGIGKTFEEAFIKAMMSAQYPTKRKGCVLLNINNKEKKSKIIDLLKIIKKIGFELDIDKNTSDILNKFGIKSKSINKHDFDYIKNKVERKKYSYIINTSKYKVITISAIKNKINFDTTINSSLATFKSILKYRESNDIISVQTIYKSLLKNKVKDVY